MVNNNKHFNISTRNSTSLSLCTCIKVYFITILLFTLGNKHSGLKILVTLTRIMLHVHLHNVHVYYNYINTYQLMFITTHFCWISTINTHTCHIDEMNAVSPRCNRVKSTGQKFKSSNWCRFQLPLSDFEICLTSSPINVVKSIS